jgi:cyclic beta-1,2-glucan synthetase
MTNAVSIMNAESILDRRVGERRDEELERLQSAVRATALWDVVHRPSSRGVFRGRIRSAARSLARLEIKLARLKETRGTVSLKREAGHAALLELCSHRKTLRMALFAVNGEGRVVDGLPRVVRAEGQEEPRPAALARVYLEAVDDVFDAPSLTAFLRILQAQEPLTLDELWNFAAFLQFELLESLLHDVHELWRVKQPGAGPAFAERIRSLRMIQGADWAATIEPLIAFEETLLQDPCGAYGKMDFDSREFYRKRVAFIARHSDYTESEVAQTLLDLAQQGGQRRNGDERMQRRCAHVGYYLVDNGLPQLAEKVGFHPPAGWRLRQWLRANAEDFYIGGILILSLVFLALVLFPVLPKFAALVPLMLALLALLSPAMQDAVDLVNNCVTALLDPEPLPRLDFRKGIPRDCATLVAVPALLLNEEQVRALVTHLEVHYLANRDASLHFGLLTDLPDSVTKPRERDSHPLVDLAVHLIEELNEKYGSPRSTPFLLLHRHRIFNQRQGVWMSWERKRGKLLDLNRLLAGELDAFPIKVGRMEELDGVRYILTLDADTQLPRGAAARLAGTIAHPLNQAIIDPRLGIVTMGYGILQPRVGISVRSAARSRLARIFSCRSGSDVYSRAVSDAYQDLFREGIFTGKGIYEVATLHAVLNHRFPRNALLSHDLIEGAYARAGLVSDVELIDDYPPHYSAYSRRQHRWVRGDWQIAQWMFSNVPDESGQREKNPISAISRWKIFDNLRRSLVDPCLLILLVAGWLGLPGGPGYWTLATLCLMFFPAAIQFAFAAGRRIAAGRTGELGETVEDLGRTLLLALLRLVLLLHQALLTCDAVFRSLFRRFISGERLLEWETSAQSELKDTPRAAADRYLGATFLTAAGLAVLIRLVHSGKFALAYAAPILVAWAISSFVAAWLNRPARVRPNLARADSEFLLCHALRIWRYFHQFSSARHNYLIPDNVQEEGREEAARVSPTNLGLLLNAGQAACALGFLTTPEFAARTGRSLGAIQRLDKFRGNLYNWYETETLRPASDAPFVSSVDSGNLVASLYTLKTGARELRRKPLLGMDLFRGLRAHWRILRAEKGRPHGLAWRRLPRPGAGVDAWIDWLPRAEAALTAAAKSRRAEQDGQGWLEEALQRLNALRDLLRDYLPWLLPEYRPLREHLGFDFGEAGAADSIEDALRVAEGLSCRFAGEWAAPAVNAELKDLALQLRESARRAGENLRALEASLDAIEQDAERLAEATEFGFYVHSDRELLSIGCSAGGAKLEKACYDLFASEARMATFLAIARGDLPQQSWFKLERERAYAFGRFVAYSWTGTMFEYLMPGLWMHSHEGTLAERIEAGCVFVQRAAARALHVPWGISESGRALRDDAGHLGYQAFGIPQVALSNEATAGPVVSPYSTFLALNVDQASAIENLRRMESQGWVGAYGFYEAADYSVGHRAPVLVREWMAHHQGMSLLAITNLLQDNLVRRWFHANPIVQATELLLAEIPPSVAVLKARQRQLAEKLSPAAIC